MIYRLSTFLLALMLFAPTTAFAHSKAKGNVPANGSIVEIGQTDLEVHFSKKVRVTSFKMHALADGQDPMADEMDMSLATPVEPTEKLGKSFTKKLNVIFDALGSGTYHYSWIAIARDGHKLKGMGHFSVSE